MADDEPQLVPGEYEVKQLTAELMAELDAYMAKVAAFGLWLAEHDRA